MRYINEPVKLRAKHLLVSWLRVAGKWEKPKVIQSHLTQQSFRLELISSRVDCEPLRLPDEVHICLLHSLTWESLASVRCWTGD